MVNRRLVVIVVQNPWNVELSIIKDTARKTRLCSNSRWKYGCRNDARTTKADLRPRSSLGLYLSMDETGGHHAR